MLAALVGTAVVTTGPSGAQEEPAAETDQVRDRQSMVAVDFDVLRAEGGVITTTIGDLADNVQAQKELLTAAEWAYSSAQSELAAAEAAVADTQNRLNEIILQADAVVIDVFINPPTDTALDALTAASLEDATIKQSILNLQADHDAELLDEYESAMEQLEIEKATKEQAAEAAEAAKTEAEAAYADVEAATGQQAAFAVEVQRRLDHRLAEADTLENVDPALAEQIRAREAEVAEALNSLDEEILAERARVAAAALAEQADANRYITGIKPVAGGVVAVACPDGGTVEVAGAISGQVERLLGDAADAGFALCGYGYRDPADQIAVRKSNCGTSSYAIYQMPASSCSPPTAKPGTSMHEQGLAIDFTAGGRTIGSTSGAYRWLKANASNYGLYNLPGEAWHWSVDGN
ncbi:MAG TPA: M15 family metallopeptidase [Acidimicrobiales bacterium]|nr:M15 family metallopeptidase [Acidimicrobiales bacterium]